VTRKAKEELSRLGVSQVGLLLIVKERWTLLKTITAFTVVHGITLVIATLGFASAPVAPLNARSR
jgi:hypothetical protein